jgi:ABC-type sugar transport system ATPase subunit
MDNTPSQVAPILRLEHVFKRFGGLTAVNDVSVDIYPGEVIGLVGDNGAGKSTLIKMISGVYRPDDGRIFLGDEEITLSSPMEARNLGIETIYQDLALCENLDATVNIFLGKEPLRRMLGIFNQVDRPHMLAESHKVLNRLDIKIPDLRKPIRQMSGGQRQAVAIARALYWNARLVIMDEPTAALGVPEQRKVHELVHTLKANNVPVIIISHNLQDVFATADRIVVMRRGSKVGDLLAQDTSGDELVSLMVGVE